MGRKRRRRCSQLGPYEVGQILSLDRQDLDQRDIAEQVQKADGTTGVAAGTRSDALGPCAMPTDTARRGDPRQ